MGRNRRADNGSNCRLSLHDKADDEDGPRKEQDPVWKSASTLLEYHKRRLAAEISHIAFLDLCAAGEVLNISRNDDGQLNNAV